MIDGCPDMPDSYAEDSDRVTILLVREMGCLAVYRDGQKVMSSTFKLTRSWRIIPNGKFSVESAGFSSMAGEDIDIRLFGVVAFGKNGSGYFDGKTEYSQGFKNQGVLVPWKTAPKIGKVRE